MVNHMPVKYLRPFLQRIGILSSDEELTPEALDSLPYANPGERPDMHTDGYASEDDKDIFDPDGTPLNEHVERRRESQYNQKRIAEQNKVFDQQSASGNEYTRPKTLEEAKQKYGFIESIFKKAGVGDQDKIDTAVHQYSEYRRRNRLAYYTEGQVDGWRFASIDQRDHRVVFRGVDDEGLIVTRTLRQRSNSDDSENAANSFDWSYADPLSCTRQIATCIRTGEEIPNGKLNYSGETPLIMQSKAFKELVEGRRAHIREVVRGEHIPGFYKQNGEASEEVFKASLKVSHITAQDENRRYGAMTNALMKSLDPEVQKIVRSVGVYEPDFANWLSGRSESSEGLPKKNDTYARNRQRAIRNYPIFADAMTRSDEIKEFIDEARPLNAVLSSKLGIPIKKLSRLQGVTWQKAGRESFRKPKILAQRIQMIDHNHVPTTRAGFAGLEIATEAARHLAAASKGESANDLVRGLDGRFEKIKELAHNNPPAGISDMARDINDRLVGPAMVQAAMKMGLDQNESLNLAYLGKEQFGPLRGLSVRSAMESSIKWHRNERVFIDKLEDPAYSAGAHWMPVLEEIDLGNGYRAKEHDSTSSLKRAGHQHDNCVGGYTDHVLGAHLLVFAIYKGDEMTSNVGLKDIREGHKKKDEKTGEVSTVRKIKVQQDLGNRNSTPSRKSQAATRTLVKQLNAIPPEKWNDYFSNLSEAKARRNAAQNLPFVSMKAGFDPTSREKLEASWECYKQLLPKPIRKKGLDAWIKDRVEPAVKQVLASTTKTSLRYRQHDDDDWYHY